MAPSARSAEVSASPLASAYALAATAQAGSVRYTVSASVNGGADKRAPEAAFGSHNLEHAGTDFSQAARTPGRCDGLFPRDDEHAIDEFGGHSG